MVPGSRLLACVAALALSACAADAPAPAATQPTPESPAPQRPATPSTPTSDTRPVDTTAGGEDDEREAPPPSEAAELDPLIASIFDRLRPQWARVLDDPAGYRLQMLITTVEANDEGPPRLVEHPYRVDAEYVYPASAIKTFASVTALHTLEELQAEHGHHIGLDSPLALCSGRSEYCGRKKDDSNLDGGVITLGHEIRKMQLVSNNTAFNRLVQFTGLDELHEILRSMGFERVRVFHPLWVSSARSEEGLSPGLVLTPSRGKKLRIPLREREQLPARVDLPRTMVGSAYLDDEQDKARVDAPMDFGVKNWVGLRDFHRLTQAIVLPEHPETPKLNLESKHLKFLRRAMSQDPLASENPAYTDEKKSELRYKTMLEGVLRKHKREHISYVNKAGRAYGFHLENAYLRDRRSKQAFFVTVVLYVNDNGVLNDDLYQYDEISRPFLRDLGEALAAELFVRPPKD